MNIRSEVPAPIAKWFKVLAQTAHCLSLNCYCSIQLKACEKVVSDVGFGSDLPRYSGFLLPALTAG